MKRFAMAALGGTLAGVILTTQVAGPLIAQDAERNASVYEQLDLFGDVFERIRSQYVEEAKTKDLIEAAINGMLSSLDPHSSYLAPDDADAVPGVAGLSNAGGVIAPAVVLASLASARGAKAAISASREFAYTPETDVHCEPTGALQA